MIVSGGIQHNIVGCGSNVVCFLLGDHRSALSILDAYIRLNLDVAVDQNSLALLLDDKEWGLQVMDAFKPNNGRYSLLYCD